MSENKNLSIEEKFQELSDIDHILLRPGHQIGNVHTYEASWKTFKPSTGKIIQQTININEALLKLVDEIISNSCDERLRETRLFDINNVKVTVNKNGTFKVSDDGGIPVVEHKVAKCYLPEMIFGKLRTSSNYSATERKGVGLNGLGAKLTNIFSKWFIVRTCDGKNYFEIKWKNNMKEVEYRIIEKAKKHGEHFTEIEWEMDIERFAYDKIDIHMALVFQKRCIDGAAANTGLKIDFETDINPALNSSWKFNNFVEFVELHLENLEDKKDILEYKSPNGKDHIVLLPSIGYNYGFVNGGACSEGTHIKKVSKQVCDKLISFFTKNGMELITAKDIQNKLSIFVSTHLNNPDYDAQNKNNLTEKIPANILGMSNEFQEKIINSEIALQLIDFYKTKYEAEKKKLTRKLNAELKKTKSKKLIGYASKTIKDTELWMFEGTSANNGFGTFRNPNFQAAYLLRGKVKNTLTLSHQEIFDNLEFREIIAASGLIFNSPKENLKNCKFDKFVIATDADEDGNHISGLLLVFFCTFFPELVVAGRIHRARSPLIVVADDKEGTEKLYYSFDEYNQDKHLYDKKAKYRIEYMKGLGSLEDHHYQPLLQDQKLVRFTFKDENYMETIKIWFNDDTTIRKGLLLQESLDIEDEN